MGRHDDCDEKRCRLGHITPAQHAADHAMIAEATAFFARMNSLKWGTFQAVVIALLIASIFGGGGLLFLGALQKIKIHGAVP